MEAAPTGPVVNRFRRPDRLTGQTLTAPAPLFIMRRFLPFTSLLCFAVAASAQAHSKTPAASAGSAEHAASLAESGHCTEALPLLTRTVPYTTDRELQKRAGMDGVRCATLLQQNGPLLDLLRVLNAHFPRDPEVLYLTVHAYSDLSTQAARELAQTAPDSIPALEMDAEANEMQGRWDEAEKSYRRILEKNPRYPGIHFRMARLLLSKPNPGPDFQDQAKKELQEELSIDPTNAGAEYVLGELARQSQDLAEAVRHFTRATQLNPMFGDAYLGLGMSLLTQKNYTDAIAPLQKATKLQPENPAAHYGLATAYARTGRREDAEHELALQQQAAEQANHQQPPKQQ